MVPGSRIWHIDPAFTDSRGTIYNIFAQALVALEEYPVNIVHVALIFSLPGSIRGNHMHSEDSHYSYILAGKAEYWEPDFDEAQVLVPGDLLFTPAGIPHAFRFIETTSFLALTTKARDGDLYEEDTHPVPVIS